LIVVDASVLANAVGDDEEDGATVRDLLRRAAAVSAPDLVDVETVAALRRLWLGGMLSDARLAAGIRDLEALPIRRYPTRRLMGRAYELRDTVTQYDATYVALAEGLGCPLVTGDARLARAPGVRCTVEVVTRAG
jgi:predicted nucleic acid-binding protein